MTAPVRLKGIRIERSRQFGDVYLALALWRGMGLEDLCERLLPVGRERVGWAKMAAVLVAARFCEPSSELHIAEDWYRRTALCDLLQLGDEEVNKDRLYRGLDHLLEHKTALEAHLSERCGELFAIQNEVLLYDVTSTYFEGQATAFSQPSTDRAARCVARSPLAQLRSKSVSLCAPAYTPAKSRCGARMSAGSQCTPPRA